MNSLTFTEFYSGWTENRAVWNKSADSVLAQLKELAQVGPYARKDIHTDNEWRPFTNHFKPAFKLLKREKKDGRTKRIQEKTPRPPYQRLLESAASPEATKVKLRAQHEALDPFALKKSMEAKLKKFFTALGNLDPESTKT